MNAASTTTTICAITLACALGTTPIASGGFVTYTDESEWMDAASSFATIEFSEFGEKLTITDEYSNLGITFTSINATWYNPGLFPSDGFGMFGGLAGWPIAMEFAQPITSIAIRYPAIAMFELYYQGELVAEPYEFFGFDPASFAGIVSTVPFDSVVIVNQDGQTSMDTLFFGDPVPAPGGVALLALGAATGGRRRRL